MNEIKMLSEMISDELEDACGYVKEALFYKDSDKELAEMFYRLSNAELDHASQEHAQVVRIIKANTKEVPTGMLEIWNWMHEQHLEKEAKIKFLLQTYKS